MSQPPFTPGKYRMANGEQAIVVCDVGENPIGVQDDYQLKGFTKDGGAEWTAEGQSFNRQHDLLEPWTDPPTLLEAAEAAYASLSGLVFAKPDAATVRDNLRRAIAAEKARPA